MPQGMISAQFHRVPHALGAAEGRREVDLSSGSGRARTSRGPVTRLALPSLGEHRWCRLWLTHEVHHRRPDRPRRQR